MRVFVALEQRFVTYKNKMYVDSVAHYDFWQRYLTVFDRVTIVARAKEVDTLPAGWHQASGDKVDFCVMPYYQGFSHFLKVSLDLWRSSRQVTKNTGAFILRVPGTIGTFLWINLMLRRTPYGLEVVGDPYESLSPEVWHNFWIRPLRSIAILLLKLQCRWAMAGVAYVTRHALQRRYPPGRINQPHVLPTGIKVFGISDVSLHDLVDRHNMIRESDMNRRFRLIFVGTLVTLYKGTDILLRAVQRCMQAGFDLELVIVGGGDYQLMLEKLSRDLQIDDHVRFLGHLTDKKAVYQQLTESDLFVLPSYTEGLPRAMIEAMAYGLPCIGTAVGGIPELLASEDLVPAGNFQLLANKIMEVASDPARLASMSARNYSTALEYREEVLLPRRVEFYKQIERITTTWSVR